MTAQQYSQLRKVFDSLMAGGILLLAFYAGVLSNEVAQMKAKIIRIESERGAVKISIEAAEGIANNRARIEALEQRIRRIEDKL